MVKVGVAKANNAPGFGGPAAASPRCRVFETTPQRFRVVDLMFALTSEFPSEAHMSLYVCDGREHQPRINKAGLPHVPCEVHLSVMVADIDLPDLKQAGQRWSKALVDDVLQRFRSVPALQTAGVHSTLHGVHVVQPLAKPVAPNDFELRLQTFQDAVRHMGLGVDEAVKDWTRLIRLPRVRRKVQDGYLDVRPVFAEYEQMVPIDPPEPKVLVAVTPTPRSASRPSKVTPRSTPELRSEATLAVPPSSVPPEWRWRVRRLAQGALAERENWHEMFLALAGALLQHRVAPELVPTICRAVSETTGNDTKTEDRVRSATSTALRWQHKLPIAAFRALATRWPHMAEAVRDAMLQGPPRPKTDRQPAADAPIPTDDDARADGSGSIAKHMADATPKKPETLELAIATTGSKARLLGAECGLGKSYALLDVAKARASRKHRERSDAAVHDTEVNDLRLQDSEPYPGIGHKTAIAANTHRLALQMFVSLTKAGVRAKRLYGPLSVLGPDGKPVCHYHKYGLPLVEGGQSLRHEFCEGRGQHPCPHADTCEIKNGWEGEEKADVAVGTYGKLGALNTFAGKTGLLACDEPPDGLEHAAFDLGQIERWCAGGRPEIGQHFDRTYVTLMRPALIAFIGWAWDAPVTESTYELAETIDMGHAAPPQRILDAAHEAAPDALTPVEYVKATVPSEGEPEPPPILGYKAYACRSNQSLAKRIGAMSAFLRVFQRGTGFDTRTRVRIKEQEGGARTVHFTYPNVQLEVALKRQGPVVLMDANMELKRDIYAKTAGYEPEYFAYGAKDKSPVERTLLHCKTATRSYWLPQGRIRLSDTLPSALRWVVEWANQGEQDGPLALITMLPIKLAIAAAMEGSDGDAARQAWLDRGRKEEALDTAVEAFKPIVKACKREVLLGHYGAMRGLNHMVHAECLATLGDPRPNLDQVRYDVDFLNLPTHHTLRLTELTQAELEQAHGRLRTVHRDRPGRALHVGSVRPSGTGWSEGVRIVSFAESRYAHRTSSSTDLKGLLELPGGATHVAKQMGVSRAALYRYVHGDRTPPEGFVEQAQTMLATSCA